MLPWVRSLADLLASLEVDQVSLSLHCLPPHPHIQAAHDGDGQVEGHHRAQHGHGPIGLDELNIALLLPHLPLPLDVLPGVDWYHPHDAAQSPGGEDHEESLVISNKKLFHEKIFVGGKILAELRRAWNGGEDEKIISLSERNYFLGIIVMCGVLRLVGFNIPELESTSRYRKLNFADLIW